MQYKAQVVRCVFLVIYCSWKERRTARRAVELRPRDATGSRPSYDRAIVKLLDARLDLVGHAYVRRLHKHALNAVLLCVGDFTQCKVDPRAARSSIKYIKACKQANWLRNELTTENQSWYTNASLLQAS